MTIRKIAPIALSALLLGAVAAYAEQPTTTQEVQEQVKDSAFFQQDGKIKSVEKFEEGQLYYAEEGDIVFYFYVDKQTLVYDNTGKEVALNVGDTISMFGYSNQPMILIYPPRYSPAVVIKNVNDSGSVKVEQFDENGLSSDGELKINVDENTKIVDREGNKVAAKELVNHSAVVFFGPTTRSIPPQTSPNKIVVFPKLEDDVTEETPDEAQQIFDMIGDDVKEVNGHKMVPIRKIAENLGYEVTATANGAVLRKGPVIYTLTRDEKAYSYNKALGYFDVAPQLLENGKTYVEFNFALKLLR